VRKIAMILSISLSPLKKTKITHMPGKRKEKEQPKVAR
jgi:hypothetical protein